MAWRVFWSPAARARLLDIGLYVEARNPEAARRLVAGILDVAKALKSQPYLGRPWETLPEIRRVVKGDYLVYYEVDEAHRVVSIITVRHGRERPLQVDQGAGED